MAKIQLSREAIGFLGGKEKLDAEITAFMEARARHATTVGEPAPTASYAVERIVLEGGGKYEVIKADDDTTPAEPEKSFEELQAEAFQNLKDYRGRAQRSGVDFHGTRFDSSEPGLTALLAAKLEADAAGPGWRQRWRVGAGSFVLLNGSDVAAIIQLVRDKHQKAFDHEYEVSNEILHADTPAKLAKIDLEKGWE